MKNKLNYKKILIIVVSILLIVLLGLGMFGIFYIKSKLNKINYVNIDPGQIEVNNEVKEEEGLEGYRTIALLGIDSRSDDYGTGNRSDCIILAAINQDTKEVSLVSVYRDTYLKLTGRNLDKVNHAYSYGGPTLALSTLNTNLDLDIKEFVTVNFEAVVESVDAIDGIELDITNEELKYINPYIREINRVTKHSSKELTEEGEQHVDGVQALAYSRIRYTAGGDYKRTERMRTVVMKAFEKAKTLNVKQLDELTDILLPKIYTNIESKEILSMIPEMVSYKVKENIGWPYKTRGATIGGIWYGPAITLESNVVKLHQEIYGQEDYTASKTVKQISNEIIRKTGYTQ